MEERGEAAAAVRLYANASQWEYEDEYDDSYDDLGGGTADGICEAEGLATLPPHHHNNTLLLGVLIPLVDIASA